MHSKEVLLMTGTINVGNTPYVKIRNDKERLLQYLCSLIAWIKLTSINTIVFCENSNTSYDFEKMSQFAKNEGKTLEVLVFDGNLGAHKYGKGYGEGIIIEYAINNSKNLNSKVDFYKITGRLFVPEFDRIQQVHANISNVFNTVPVCVKSHEMSFRLALRYFYIFLYSRKMYRFNIFIKALKTRVERGSSQLIDNYVYTIFYKSNVEFFKKYLMQSYKRVDDTLPYWLEHAYHDDLLKKDFSPFLIDYHVVGRSGGRGELVDGLDYKDDIKELAKTFI